MTRYIGLFVMMGCGVSQPSTPSQGDTGAPGFVRFCSAPAAGGGDDSGTPFKVYDGTPFEPYTGCDDVHPQGPYLVGQVLDAPPFTNVADPYYFHITDAYSGTTHVTLSVTNTAALEAPGHPPLDPAFNGLIVSNGMGTLQLSAQRGTTAVTHFTLKRKSTGAAYDTVVCDDAVPVQGRYRSDGTRVDDSAYVTFACSEADVYKCISWGYGPRQVPDAHQACTRMARDDIFGNGRSHTHLDTMIGFHDRYSINGYPTDEQLHVKPATLPPDPHAMFFEAAYGPNGPVCLGRFRWQSLRPDALSNLPDPRTHDGALSCDDDTVDSLIAKGAILFTWSYFNDFPLFRWHTSTDAGDDYVTTVRGYFSALAGQGVPPFSDGLAYTFDTVDGYLLRAIPGSVTDPDTELKLTTLYHEITTGRMVLALASDARLDPTRFAAFPTAEGWVFTSYHPGMVALGMFYDEASGDYLSTTAANTVPPQYVSLGIIGWVFPVDTATP